MGLGSHVDPGRGFGSGASSAPRGLREGFADVSFRLRGRRGWSAIGLALIFPIVFGMISYGIAWTTGLVQFSPEPIQLVAPYVGETASPVMTFVINLAVAATIVTVYSVGTAAGEEIGWRGYMLTRLIDAGWPKPILSSGLIWGPLARAAHPGRGVPRGSAAGPGGCALDGYGHGI